MLKIRSQAGPQDGTSAPLGKPGTPTISPKTKESKVQGGQPSANYDIQNMTKKISFSEDGTKIYAKDTIQEKQFFSPGTESTSKGGGEL